MTSDIRISFHRIGGGWVTRAILGAAFVDFSGLKAPRTARREAADLLLTAPH